jgi:hypothetical protein
MCMCMCFVRLRVRVRVDQRDAHSIHVQSALMYKHTYTCIYMLKCTHTYIPSGPQRDISEAGSLRREVENLRRQIVDADALKEKNAKLMELISKATEDEAKVMLLRSSILER